MTEQVKTDLSARIDTSLSHKVSIGIIWVTAIGICGRGLSFISNIILARILTPSDFGLMAIAMALISFLQGTTSTGFESALIQKQDRPKEFLNVVWTFEMLRYLVLFLILLLAAPLFSSLFNEPRVTAMIRVVALSFVFQGLRNIGVVYFRKHLDFSKQFVLEITPLITNILIVVPLAFILRDVWALIWANLASSLVNCIISYTLHPYRPRFDFQIKKAKELFNFGKWILGISIIGILRVQGITMFVGKYFGMSVLGWHNRAGVFSTMLFQQLNEIVWRVGYPAYSQVQIDPNRIKQAYLKTLQLLTFVGIPMAGGLFVLSIDFIHLFLTDKWLPLAPLIQILCFQSIIGFINTPASILFQASGKPSISTKIILIDVILLIILIYPLSLWWGISGTLFSLFLSAFFTSPIIWFKAMKVAKCSFSEFIKPVLFPLVNTMLMASVIFKIKKYVFIEPTFAGFFSLIFVGMLFYFTAAYFFDRCMNYGIYGLIKERVKTLRP